MGGRGNAEPKPRNYRQTVCTYWLRGLCMKGDTCGFLHQFDPERMPVCRSLLKFGVCKEPGELAVPPAAETCAVALTMCRVPQPWFVAADPSLTAPHSWPPRLPLPARRLPLQAHPGGDQGVQHVQAGVLHLRARGETPAHLLVCSPACLPSALACLPCAMPARLPLPAPVLLACCLPVCFLFVTALSTQDAT